MDRNAKRANNKQISSRELRLPALCVIFALGAILGHIAAQLAGDDGKLSAYLYRFAASQGDAATVSISVIQTLAVYLRYPLLMILLGYCSFAIVAIPLMLAIQGFSLSFSAAMLAISLGRKGVMLALAAFGLRSITTVVCTLLLAISILDSVTGNKGHKHLLDRKSILVCFFLLVVSIVLEVTVVPKLFSLALKML